MVARGVSWGGKDEWAAPGVLGSETILYSTLMVDTRHHTFLSKPTEYTPQSIHPNVSYGL